MFILTSLKMESEPAAHQENSAQNAQDPSASSSYPRWWATVEIGGAQVRALVDSGVARTAMSPNTLLIAAACGRKVLPYRGAGARTATKHVIPIVGHVKLPFTIAQVTYNHNVIILETLDAD